MLYEHNVSVFNGLVNILSNDTCACVVMGTGVGKSYVALEYLTHFNLKALIVSPRNSINESWKKLCGDKADVITYQKLANIYKEVDFSSYDVIICDEVHHIGAVKWGEPIKFLINSGKKVIGLTESSVRYTDGGRDVANEFFHGNVVFGESVASAIEKKILNPVTYVGAMYNSDGLKKTIRGKIQSRLYAKLNLAINKTPTVIEILKKNMPSGKRKGIIFASTINDINYAVDFIHSVYPNVEIKCVHSKQSDANNEAVFNWFKNVDEGYICSVDMISEGVHIKGVNTLIMLRRTESVNLFNQQLGRCLDAASKEPAVVFDLVNNKYSIRIIKGRLKVKVNSLFNASQLNVIPSEQLIINDYTKDIVEVLEEIKYSLEGKWTKEEIQIVKDNFDKGYKTLCKLIPNHSVNGIKWQAGLLGLTDERLESWSTEEDEILRKYYPDEGPRCATRLSKRNEVSVRARANKLKIRSKTKISPEELDFIKDNYLSLGAMECAKAIDRDYNTVVFYAKRFGYGLERKYWTSEEDEILIKYYKSEGPSGCSKRLTNRDTTACANRAGRLGLKEKNQNVPWTEEEINILKTYYPIEGYECFKRLPNRTRNSCQTMAQRRLKLKKRD